MVERAAVVASLEIKAHAHMLRHACGYKLVNDGHDTRALQAYLGHPIIQNTTSTLVVDRYVWRLGWALPHWYVVFRLFQKGPHHSLIRGFLFRQFLALPVL